MTSQPRKVTAELRKWRRKTLGNVEAIEGFVHNDVNKVWKDGALGLIYPVVRWEETTFYWFAHTNTALYECAKDEELKDVAAKDTPSS
jgi:hypothetical protein